MTYLQPQPPPKSLARTVQIDSLVIMKISKHVESERMIGTGGVAYGQLMGLVEPGDKDRLGRLEVTNCYPLIKVSTVITCYEARPPSDDAGEMRSNETDEQKQLSDQADLEFMLKNARRMLLDYEPVGFYHSKPYGAAFEAQLVEDLFKHQSALSGIGPDNIVLVYDPVKTYQGHLSLRAFRLSDKAMELLSQDNVRMAPEILKQHNLTYTNLFEELPITIKNSHLISVLLAEMKLNSIDKPQPRPYLEVSSSDSLSKCMNGIINQIDVLNKSTHEFNRYTLNKLKAEQQLEQLKQKRMYDNMTRRERGEPELPMDELHSSIKWPTLGEDGMLPALLAANELTASVQYSIDASRDNLGKLYVLDNMVEERVLQKGRTQSQTTMSSQ